jgi:hypothetical protein
MATFPSPAAGDSTGTLRVRRLWAWPLLGIAVAVLGVVTSAGVMIEVPKSERIANPALVLELAQANRLRVMAFTGAGLLVWPLLIVYAARLRQYLAARQPEHSILPTLAWAGGLLTAAVQFIALFFSSLLVHRAAEGYRASALEPIQAVSEGLPFGAWSPMGLAVFAVAVAGLRDHAVPRWLGIFSAGIAALMVVVTATNLVSPNWFLVAVWLLVTSITLLVRGATVHQPNVEANRKRPPPN